MTLLFPLQKGEENRKFDDTARSPESLICKQRICADALALQSFAIFLANRTEFGSNGRAQFGKPFVLDPTVHLAPKILVNPSRISA